jgi:iron-sulfur cluster repair protein YtfE (RIC family)
MKFNIVLGDVRMTSPRSEDPIAELSHDHSHLGALVQAVRGTLASVERKESSWEDARTELEDGAESLREGLLLHFAREEEALFPFVEGRLPELADRVAKLLADHDAVVVRASELCRIVETTGTNAPPQCISAFARFEETYAAHAQAEHGLLRDVDAALDQESRSNLRALLAAI